MSGALLRTRWAAIGAAVAISLGAGGIGIIQATTSSGEKPIYVPVEPCRLADTRPEYQVGPRATPLGAGETYTLSGWGTVGECTLPTGTTGLSLNVTATDPTLPTFLTLFPADSTLPLASHLNPVPDQPPTPNAVNVDLDTSGELGVYNRFGAVNVIVDVVGYYDHHTHDDRYYTESEVDGALAAKANSADVYTEAQVNSRLAGKVDTDQVLSAVVSSSGTLDRGIGAVSAQLFSPGNYEVVFDRDVTPCVFTAAPGATDQVVVSERIVSVARRSGVANGVYVLTENLSGIETNASFHLVVVCP